MGEAPEGPRGLDKTQPLFYLAAMSRETLVVSNLEGFFNFSPIVISVTAVLPN
jgi:hypothetical protein